MNAEIRRVTTRDPHGKFETVIFFEDYLNTSKRAQKEILRRKICIVFRPNWYRFDGEIKKKMDDFIRNSYSNILVVIMDRDKNVIDKKIRTLIVYRATSADDFYFPISDSPYFIHSKIVTD